jgi:hypothetical protein
MPRGCFRVRLFSANPATSRRVIEIRAAIDDFAAVWQDFGEVIELDHIAH